MTRLTSGDRSHSHSVSRRVDRRGDGSSPSRPGSMTMRRSTPTAGATSDPADDVQPRIGRRAGRRLLERGEEHRNQLVGPICGIAQTFSVLHTLRSSECSTAAAEHVGSARLAGDHPGATGPVEAHRRTGLRRPRRPVRRPPHPSHGRRRARGGGRRTRHVRRCAPRDSTSCTAPTGRPAAAQRRPQRVLDDRPCGAERVGADAEHHRVAAAQHTAGVGEHVRADPRTRSRPHRAAPGAARPTSPRGRPGRPLAPRSRTSSRHVRRPATMSRRIALGEHEPGRRATGRLRRRRRRARSPRRSARTRRRRRSGGRTRRRRP